MVVTNSKLTERSTGVTVRSIFVTVKLPWALGGTLLFVLLLVLFVYVKNKTAVICHPKTGSCSLSDILTAQMGFRLIGTHHSMEPVAQYDTVVSVIRDPFGWYTSWFFHMVKRNHVPEGQTFDEWLRGFCAGDNRWHRKGFFALKETTHVIFYEDLQQGLTDAIGAPTLSKRNAGPRVPVETKVTFDRTRYDQLKAAREGSFLKVEPRHKSLLEYNPFFCIKDIDGQIPKRIRSD